MSKKAAILATAIFLLGTIAYSTKPIISDFYQNWKDANTRKWNMEYEKRQSEATIPYSQVKSLSTTMPVANGNINITINYKAVGFNQVAFRLNLQPISDIQFGNLTKTKYSGETIIYLNLRDSDGFRLAEIGFTYPTRFLDKNGTCIGVGFEETHQVEFSVLDKVKKFDISSKFSFSR